MRDNRLEWGGVWRILKQLPALKKKNPEVNTKIHMMKERAPPHFYLQRQSQHSCFYAGGNI